MKSSRFNLAPKNSDKGFSGKTPEEKAEYVLSLWKKITRREVDVPDEAKSRIAQALKEMSSIRKEMIEYRVRVTKYIPPLPGDDDDIERLISSFTSDETYNEAVLASSDVRSVPYLWVDANIRREDIAEISEIIGIDPGSLSTHEYFCIMELCRYTNEEIEDACEKNGSDTPSTVLERIKGFAVTYPGTDAADTYKAFVKKKEKEEKEEKDLREKLKETASKLESDTMEVDVQATEMIHLGVSSEKILSYHNDVPEGYWEKVLEIINYPEVCGDADVAYQLLEDDFGGFNPNNREQPKI